MPTFSVNPADLRTARTALDSLGKVDVDVTGLTATMHAVVLPEAAGLLQSVAEKASTQLCDIAKLMAALSDGLGAAARIYEAGERHVVHNMGGH